MKLAACGHVSASSQSLRFILSLRMNSSFITSRPSFGELSESLSTWMLGSCHLLILFQEYTYHWSVKQLGSRSGLAYYWACSGFKLFARLSAEWVDDKVINYRQRVHFWRCEFKRPSRYLLHVFIIVCKVYKESYIEKRCNYILLYFVNPMYTNGFLHTDCIYYQVTGRNFKTMMYFCPWRLFLSKQCRPRWKAAFYGISSGSSLLGQVPVNRFQFKNRVNAQWIKPVL